MKSYIITIITVSVISGIISAMLPEGNNSVKKQLNFITGLICAIALLTPVVTIAKNAAVISNNVEDFVSSFDVNSNISEGNKIIIESGTEQIAKGVKEALLNKYKFKEENVSVSVSANEEKIDAIFLEKITITLRNEATWTDGNNVKQYVEDLVGCPIQVVKL